jgi:hypothetical protein
VPALSRQRRKEVAMPWRATSRIGLAAAFAAAAGMLGGLAPSAHAGVFKCQAEGGGLIYQEDPCPPGKELRNFETDPPTLSVIPGTTAPAPARPADKPIVNSPRSAQRTSPGADDRSNGRVNGDPSARRFIRPGMTDAEVRARIGQPDITAGGNRSRNARWSYLPAAGDPDTLTTITFSGNTVSDVSRKVLRK